MVFRPGKFWKLLGGKSPSRDAGTVWMARNDALAITNENSDRHPVIILQTGPIRVIPGSDSFRHDLDAVVEEFDNSDLEVIAGGGFTSRTAFDVCRDLPISDPVGLLHAMGKLNRKAWQRLLDARKHCW